MLTKSLRRMGVTSDLAYLAGLLSIGASIATWAAARRNSDPSHAERFGIFIGLWPPTFFLGNALKQVEAAS
jgi:ABC-type dipeptide/oligopeptide/nickel transport system permease component